MRESEKEHEKESEKEHENVMPCYIIPKINGHVIENMYEVLCQTHADITQHGGQKQTWKSIIENWGWIKQNIVEKFVNNCTICAVRKPSFHPLAAKPIIAKNFLSRVQVY
ncbi:hypothetical protein RhiirA4_467211 [Rhizophagus irregularis]|uniref:Integrase zinc-binding domain-containing protein n=1 Tax=Rhizophagus irregularis TaxID=588596 RepID=A0A2I1GVF7_9GLOM|nr:hypothetical protein RhiirA4_467211 [Rhizophagus irregularis]